MERKHVALTGHRIAQYAELRDWLSDHQQPGDPQVTPQVVIELAFDELLRRKNEGEPIVLYFTDERHDHAWREKRRDQEETAITV